MYSTISQTYYCWNTNIIRKTQRDKQFAKNWWLSYLHPVQNLNCNRRRYTKLFFILIINLLHYSVTRNVKTIYRRFHSEHTDLLTHSLPHVMTRKCKPYRFIPNQCSPDLLPEYTHTSCLTIFLLSLMDNFLWKYSIRKKYIQNCISNDWLLKNLSQHITHLRKTSSSHGKLARQVAWVDFFHTGEVKNFLISALFFCEYYKHFCDDDKVFVLRN